MLRAYFARLALCAASVIPILAASAQDTTDVSGLCSRPDSIEVTGNTRTTDAVVRADAGIAPGTLLNYRAIQRAIKNLYTTEQFDDIQIVCRVAPSDTGGPGRAILGIVLRERPLLTEVSLRGVDRVSKKTIREQIDRLPIGQPLNPVRVARVVQVVDSVYEAAGYYLARIRPESTVVDDLVKLEFNINEGHRFAISGVRIEGNSEIGDGDVVGAMKTRPEGFWWWRRGKFDDDTYAVDLGERIPGLYAGRGYIDLQIVKDTLIIDRDRGKALIDLTLSEGKQYRVGSFEILGNRRFSTEELRQFYPFTGEAPTLAERVTDIVRRRDRAPAGIFDQAQWRRANEQVQTLYRNEGYIYASVRPVVERVTDTSSVVNLRWEIDERSPAIINRIEIVGNDYTTESCIRDQLIILPGDVFNQDRLVRSYQNISNLGFFESPSPPPDTRTANEDGDVDIIFTVKEKRTGNLNFGASMGQGTGIGGFIGLDQPNLFGLCKRANLQWQFGRYINDFNLSYTDPTILHSRISGTVNAYRTQARYNIADLGRSLRTGGAIQLGFPVPNSPFARVFVSYGGESVKFGTGGLLGEQSDLYQGSSFRSTFGLSATRDTRIDMPFATAGGMQTITTQFNGGILGGTATFQRYTAEVRSYAPIGTFGGTKPGSQPRKFTVGLTGKTGAVFGDPGPFFYSQAFALGGVQYGEQLRGYDEFSITPQGYVTGTDRYSARRESFGSAYLTMTAEMGFRYSQSLYFSLFYDAGNVWDKPRDIDPTRLFRGAGIGLATVTPLGPLGLDYAYGFDRLDAEGRRAPRWKLHFRLGQLF